jgi:hypothetical protein
LIFNHVLSSFRLGRKIRIYINNNIKRDRETFLNFLIHFKSYDYKNIFLNHARAKRGKNIIKEGIDFKHCTESDEWDIVDTAAKVTHEPSDEIARENFYPGILGFFPYF